jgi:hypothetical protein
VLARLKDEPIRVLATGGHALQLAGGKHAVDHDAAAAAEGYFS